MISGKGDAVGEMAPYTSNMRTLLSVAFLLAAQFNLLQACLCERGGSPCDAVGSSAAAFSGTVIEIANRPVQPFAGGTNGRPVGDRTVALMYPGSANLPLPRPLRAVRLRVADVLSGVAPGQNEIEIKTGMGGGDCGYPFEVGRSYVVYAYKNAEGQLETSVCSRTQPLAEAGADLQYFHAMANAPVFGEVRVSTAYSGFPVTPGANIILDRGGTRYSAATNSVGTAVFSGLAPGEYIVHKESDGDLPDDPAVELFAKGCRNVTLFRALRITGRVTTKNGQPAARVWIEAGSTKLEATAEGRMTDADGHYEIRLVRPGVYYLGINLDHTPNVDAPYPRWFYPGTENPGLATIIEFSGKPSVQVYDFSLPERQPECLIEGVVLRADGNPRPQARLSVIDASDALVASGIADQNGRFLLRVFAGTPYRLDSVWPAGPPEGPSSAVPVDISAGSEPVNLKLGPVHTNKTFAW